MIFVPAPTLAFAERYLPLSEFCARLAKAEGTDIVCRADIADRKLTLFTKERPTSEIRSAVETFANLKFERTKSGWSLVPDPVWEKAEREYEAHLKAEKRAGVLRELDKWAGLAIHSQAELSDMRERARKAAVTGPPEEREAATRELNRLAKADDRPTSPVMIGAAWRTMSAASRERVLSGGYAVAATPGLLDRPDAVIDRRYLPPIVRYGGDTPGASPDAADHLFVFGPHPERDEICVSHNSWSPGSAQGGGWFANPPWSPADQEARNKLSINKRWAAWSVRDATTESVELRGTATVPTTDNSRRAGTAEHLSWLHARTGVSICAEAFRKGNLSLRTPEVATVRDWARSYGVRGAPGSPYFQAHGMIRAVNGWVGAMAYDVSERRSREPSEKSVAALSKSPTLAGAIAFAHDFRSGSPGPHPDLLLDVPFRGTDRTSFTTLRLLGHLSGTSGPWRVNRLSTVAREAVRGWFRERVWMGTLPKPLALALATGQTFTNDVVLRIASTTFTGNDVLDFEWTGQPSGPQSRDGLRRFSAIKASLEVSPGVEIDGTATLFRIGSAPVPKSGDR